MLKLVFFTNFKVLGCKIATKEQCAKTLHLIHQFIQVFYGLLFEGFFEENNHNRSLRRVVGFCTMVIKKLIITSPSPIVRTVLLSVIPLKIVFS